MSVDQQAEIPLSEEELRQVTQYAATCARQVLPFFEAAHPLDTRPKEAIVEAEAFAGGQRRTGALRKAGWAALAAARETDNPIAAHAAYAASHAAAAAYLHPIASHHQVKHILGAAVHMMLTSDTDATSLANTTVREVLRRYPSPPRGKGDFNQLLHELDTTLRSNTSQ